MALITVSGTQCIGKSTFIEDFITQWPMYKTPEKTYRDVIREKNLTINRETTKESQKIILESIIDIMDSYKRSDNIIFDRSPIDNLVYSLWAYDKGQGDIDEDFISDCIKIVRGAMQKIDLMFLIPITKFDTIKLEESSLRDVDPVYRREINELFQSLKQHCNQENGRKREPFFIEDDCAPMVEIFGERQARIEMCKLYFKEDGSFYGEEDSILFDSQGDKIGQGDDQIDGGERDQLREMLGLQKDNLYRKDKYEL
jgi:thymidylate kinase